MKIGLLHYTSPPVVGGVEAILARHALLMTKAGHKVQIIAGRGAQIDPRIPFHSVPLVDSIQADVLSLKSELDQGRIPQKFEDMVVAITALLEPLFADLDLLIAHNVCSLHKNLALTAALKRYVEKNERPKFIHWHHDFAWSNSRYRSQLYDGYPWNLIRTNMNGVVQVVVSEFRRKEMTALFKIPAEQIRMIPNGIDVREFLGLNEQTSTIVKQLGLLSAAPLILLPVRITARKNIELALQTVGELKKRFPKVQLVITGPPGPHNPANQQYFSRLKLLREQLSLGGSVHFLAEVVPDSLPDEVIFGLYRLSDLLILPSFEEGFGLPVIEASQARLPIFCSDIGPLRELAMDHADYFSPQSSPENVAVKIEKHLAASSIYQMRLHLRNFEWDHLYDGMIAPLLQEAKDHR